MKLFVQSIQGPENAVNGVFPIMIASQAAEAGHEVSIFLAGNAVSLMKTEIVDNMSAIGIGKLSDHIKVLKDKGVTIHLSAGSCKARGITEDDIKDKNGVMSGPPGLLKLVEKLRKFCHTKLITTKNERGKMILKIEGPIETFAKWKAMVHSNAEKIKKYGMTFLYAGSEKGDDSKFIGIIRFDTMEGVEAFKG